jgi:hypothetical protein
MGGKVTMVYTIGTTCGLTACWHIAVADLLPKESPAAADAARCNLNTTTAYEPEPNSVETLGKPNPWFSIQNLKLLLRM